MYLASKVVQSTSLSVNRDKGGHRGDQQGSRDDQSRPLNDQNKAIPKEKAIRVIFMQFQDDQRLKVR